MIQDIYVLLDDGDRRVLRAFQLSPTQYAALLLLDAEAGLRSTDLSARLLIDKSTTTRLIDRLVELGFVVRLADPADRRAQRLLITERGSSQLAAARAAHERSRSQRWSALDSAEQDLLASLLAKLRRKLAADVAGPERG